MMTSVPWGCAPSEGAFRGSLVGSGGVCMCSPSHPLPDGQPSIIPPEACHHGGVQQVGIHGRVMRGSLGGQEGAMRGSGGGQEGARRGSGGGKEPMFAFFSRPNICANLLYNCLSTMGVTFKEGRVRSICFAILRKLPNVP